MNMKSFIYKHLVPNFIKRFRHKLRTRTYPIIKDAIKVFPVLCQVKEGTWEEMIYPPLYRRTKEQYMKVYTEPQYAFEIPNAIINSDSDTIVTEKGVYWDKYNEEEFMTWANPGDFNVAHYDRDSIAIIHSRKKERIEGLVLSLIGTCCYHWEHFLLQFACKMYYAGENGLLDREVTILYQDRGDKCIKQFIDDYVVSFPKVRLKYADRGVDYYCERLISIPATTPNFNDYKFRLDYPYFISLCVVERIDKYVVKPYIDRVKNNKPKYDKLFLGRRGMRRTLTNYDEVHDYFAKMGFVDVEGAELTVEQKANLFYHAKEIVGLVGGAEENLIFCNGAKCMFLMNYRMTTQSAGYMQMKNKVACWINVAGQDESSDYHCNFTIPLEKVKAAYQEYIHPNENFKS